MQYLGNTPATTLPTHYCNIAIPWYDTANKIHHTACTLPRPTNCPLAKKALMILVVCAADCGAACTGCAGARAAISHVPVVGAAGADGAAAAAAAAGGGCTAACSAPSIIIGGTYPAAFGCNLTGGTFPAALGCIACAFATFGSLREPADATRSSRLRCALRSIRSASMPVRAFRRLMSRRGIPMSASHHQDEHARRPPGLSRA